MKYKSLITGYIGNVCYVEKDEILNRTFQTSSVVELTGNDIKYCTVYDIESALKHKQIIKL